MSFLVRWFFPRKRAQMLQMLQENDEAYSKKFEEFELEVEKERLKFDAYRVEFENQKIEIEGLTLDMKARRDMFEDHLMEFIWEMMDRDVELDSFTSSEDEPEGIPYQPPGAGDMNLEMGLETSQRSFQNYRELMVVMEGMEGLTDLEDHLWLLEDHHRAFADVRRRFVEYKLVMENNEKKLKRVLDEYKDASRDYDAYQRMRWIGPYAPWMQAMNGTFLPKTQPMGWIGVYFPWIHALNGGLGNVLGGLGYISPGFMVPWQKGRLMLWSRLLWTRQWTRQWTRLWMRLCSRLWWMILMMSSSAASCRTISKGAV